MNTKKAAKMATLPGLYLPHNDEELNALRADFQFLTHKLRLGNQGKSVSLSLRGSIHKKRNFMETPERGKEWDIN